MINFTARVAEVLNPQNTLQLQRFGEFTTPSSAYCESVDLIASDLYSVTVYFSDTKLIGLLFFSKIGLTTLVGTSKGAKSQKQILIKNTLVGF